MTKLCPRGKAAAKRKFKVYPSAYANAYASKICAGKIKDPSGVKRKDFRGPKPTKAEGGRIGYREGRRVLSRQQIDRLKGLSKSPTKMGPKPNEKRMTPEQREKRFKRRNFMGGGMTMMPRAMYKKGGPSKKFPDLSGDGKVTMKDILMGRGVIKRPGKMGGGLMEATQRLRRQGLRGGGLCKKGMNREAIGKNS